VEPVLALLNFDQMDVTQFFIHSHIIGINLNRRPGESVDRGLLSLGSEGVRNMPPQMCAVLVH
jgi:hypothetical protein